MLEARRRLLGEEHPSMLSVMEHPGDISASRTMGGCGQVRWEGVGSSKEIAGGRAS